MGQNKNLILPFKNVPQYFLSIKTKWPGFVDI